VETADLGRLIPCSSYFMYYLLKAYFACGRADLAFKRLEVWRNYLKVDAKTPFETDNLECRSDCHAWSAAPIAILAEEVAGVKSVGPGFRQVCIAPQPGPLKMVRASVPCPDGLIEVELRMGTADQVSGRIVLPKALTGTFVWHGVSRALKAGVNAL